MDQMKQDSLLAAAKRLCDLMYAWNVVDVHELVVDDPRDGGSVYHHTNKALKRTLEHLGLHEASVFYDLVTQGEAPKAALEAALELQAEHAL
jgi:hypothetical protein